ncbi:MAG: hypothetical protein HOQ24_01995 [Mycobacteriaceae bacterium]|nr:hypothetical protein [Mycobacteriaceae bacterium]
MTKRGIVRAILAGVVSAAMTVLTAGPGQAVTAIAECGTVTMTLTYMGKKEDGTGTRVGIRLDVFVASEFGTAVDINAHVSYTGGDVDAPFAGFTPVGRGYIWEALVESSGSTFTATASGDIKTSTAPPRSTPYCVILQLTGSTDTSY